MSLVLGGAAQANPEGGTVVGGSATISQEPGQTLIQQHSDRAIINWQGFSIGASELTRFQQPSAAAVALNRVTGGQVSNILGRLEANGQVYLVNPNGIVFGPNAVVDVAGLIAATHDIRDQDFLAGQLDFTIPGAANARILNQGLITAAEGGLVALVAPSVANSGVIRARLGQVAIAGTNAATIDPYGDDLIVFRADSQVVASLTDPDHNPLAALVDISGEITADGGRVLITAEMARGVVNSAIDMTGIVQARSIEMQNGEIVLIGGDGITNIAGTLDATGSGPGETGGAIEVSGDVIMHRGTIDASGGNGGTVSVAGRVVFNQGGILADGTAGSGGEIHIQSARNYLDVTSSVTSAAGATGGGRIVIDGGPEGSVYSSGEIDVTSNGGTGGSVDVVGRDLTFVAAGIDATGATGGGTIRIGGDFQGRGELPRAETVYVSSATTISADATENGDGGTVILWSDQETLVGGSISARGGAAGGDGGLIEVSSADAAAFAGTADAAAPQGQAGELLLDPKNITIDDTTGRFPQFDLVDPLAGAGNSFGDSIVPLSTGNVVVADSSNDSVATDAGAVHLFDGSTGALISTITGSTASDQVSSRGVVALANGNIVIASPKWDNGGIVDAGAATWVNGTTGLAGVVSTVNSLYGTTAGDQVADGNGGAIVVALTNGNYVVSSIRWNNGGIVDAGAVTWGDGATGITGAVSTGNSLYGTTASDFVGGGITALTNGNFVIRSGQWNNGGTADVGAVTWGNGASGITGAVSTANSLYGSTAGDAIGNRGIEILTNGNYVVQSSNWDNGGIVNAGAATWGDGTTGITGAISTTNSLHGTTAGDSIGFDVTALTNGNYVVWTGVWDNGGIVDAGHATWGSGTTGISGAVSTANSLYGTTAGDNVGSAGATALTNGNYVVSSKFWDNSAITDAGHATWGNGATGITGAVSTSNSLYGTTAGDNVGDGVIDLANGNYLVTASQWDNGGIVNAGAVTWGNGTTGITGAVSTANSLHGTTAGDNVGGTATSLTNGNYVVASSSWDNGGVVNAGAATWGSGTAGITGAVSTANSLYGTTALDQVGFGVSALNNGNYVVESQNWDNGATADAGAVTWGDGTTGITGAVSTTNSLHGTTAGDRIGSNGGTEFDNGNFVVQSGDWDDGGLSNVGAATFVDGSTGQTLDGSNVVSAQNSVIGQAASAGLISITDDKVNNSFLVRFTAGGGRVVTGLTDLSQITFDRGSLSGMVLPSAILTHTLNAGTAVTLQASNDITVNSAIVVNNGAGDGGALTLQAGRSILVNADIFTDNGNLSLFANDLLVNGVIDAQRDAGAAVIAMAPGTTLDAGTGTVTIELHNGTGKTNTTSGDIILGNVIGGSVIVKNDGPTAGSDILMASATEAITANTVNLAAGAGNDIVLDNAGNDFASVAIASARNVVLAVANALDFAASTISGFLNLTAGGAITDSGNLIVAATTTLATSAAVNIVLDSAGNDFSTIGVASAQNVTLVDVNALDLAASTISGTLDVTSSGPITDSGDVSVAGAATFAAGTGNDISFDSAGNDFSTIGVTSAKNVILVDANAIDLAISTISGTLDVTSSGAITDSGNLNVTGATTLAAGAGNDITLDYAGNDFSSIGVTSAQNVTLVDVNSLVLATSTISGTLDVTTSGSITDSGTLIVTGGATFSAPGGNIVLDSAGNDFSTVTINSGNSATLVDTNAIDLGNMTMAGGLTVTASGAITDSGTLTFAGSLGTFSAPGSDITLDSAANNFQRISITSGRNVALRDVNALELGASTISGSLDVTTAGVLTDTGNLSVAGITTLATGAGNSITLDSIGNDFNSVGVTSAGNVTLVDANTIDLAASTISGTLSVAASGAITDSGSLNVSGATTLAADAANDITLDNAGNDFASIAIASARNVVLAVANALDFAASTISGILTVTAGGAITDSGKVTVAGATTLTTGTAVNISLDSIGNDFSSLGVTSAKNVTLVDANALTLTASTISGSLDVTAGGALGGGYLTVQSLKVAGTSVALTGSIAGGTDQAAANSIALTSLGGGPYTFNGYVIGAAAAATADPTLGAALDQQAAQIGTASAETTTTATVTAELTPESTTTALIVTEPLDSGGTTETTTETTASEQTIETIEEVMVEGSIVEAVAYINGEGDVSLADQQEFFQSLDGAEIVDGLLSSDDPTAQSIGQVFEEIAGGAEIGQAEMKSRLQDMGVSGGKMLSYLGLFARVQKHARTEMFEAALETLLANPELANVEVVAPGARPDSSESGGRKIALLIGIDVYAEPLPSLNTPTSDVEAVGALLEQKLGYETRILKNATKAEMVEALQALVDELNEEDSVVVFYAGHGYILESNGIGYWLPADATYDSAENWVSNKNVSEFLNAMRAKNIMLIADSCYSGSLLAGEQQVEGVRVRLNREELKDKRSVVILSSGGEEPVQDDGGEGHSVFARQLMTVLEGMNTDSVGIELYEEVKTRLAELAPQVPQYGGIISAGHEAGADHLFELGS